MRKNTELSELRVAKTIYHGLVYTFVLRSVLLESGNFLNNSPRVIHRHLKLKMFKSLFIIHAFLPPSLPTNLSSQVGYHKHFLNSYSSVPWLPKKEIWDTSSLLSANLIMKAYWFYH